MGLDFLSPVGMIVNTIKTLVEMWDKAQQQQDQENTSIRTDLIELVEELRKTHTTIVKLVSPLRRIPDDPATFADHFRNYYSDFRDTVDAFDFGEARMHCHKIEQIRKRMEQRKPKFGSEALWNQFYDYLSMLSRGDFTIIDTQFKPFMAEFDQTMQRVYQHIEAGDIAGAITEKKIFVASLISEFDKNKSVLEEMNDLIGELTAKM